MNEQLKLLETKCKYMTIDEFIIDDKKSQEFIQSNRESEVECYEKKNDDDNMDVLCCGCNYMYE